MCLPNCHRTRWSVERDRGSIIRTDERSISSVVSAFDVFPPVNAVKGLMRQVTGRGVRLEGFSLPHDLAYRFVAAGWRRPEVYLKAEVRAGMSAFRLADQTVVERGVMRLGHDLESGAWQRNYGWVREQESYDAGYRFVCVDAATSNG